MIPPITVAFLVLGVITIWTNCTYMVIIWRNKKLHTTTNWLLFSLSISDVCVGGLSAPFLAGLLDLTIMSAKTSAQCQVMAVCLLLFPSISVAHLGFVTAERYITIIYPLRSLSIITTHRLVYAIILCWTVPIVLFSSTSFAWTKLSMNIGNASNFTCSLLVDVPCYVFDNLLSGVLAFYILSTVMYVRIFVVALTQARRVAAERRFGAPSQTRYSFLAYRLKGAFLIFVTIGVFASSYLPLAIRLVVQCKEYNNTEEDLIWQIFSFLSFANSAVNPLIYGLGNRTFREELFATWRNIKRKHNVVDMSLYPKT